MIMNKDNIINNLRDNISVDKFRRKKSQNDKIKNLCRKTFAVIVCFFSLTGIVFAREISTKVYENFWQTGNGIGHAMEEGYIEEPKSSFENSVSVMENKESGEKLEDLETAVKVDEMLMDDFNLSLTFNVNLSDKALDMIQAEDIWEMNFTDILITDENGYILFAGSEQYKNINFDSDNFVNTGVNTFLKKRSGNTLKAVYNIYTGLDTFPKSKELNIKFTKINISKDETVNTMFGEGEITLIGNWEFKLNVPEKMYNRTNLIYAQKSSTNKKYTVSKAVVYQTGMQIDLEVLDCEKLPKEPTIPELEFYKTLSEDSEFRSAEYNISSYLYNKLYVTQEYQEYIEAYRKAYEIEVYLLNGDKEKFEFTQGPRENGSKSISEDGILKYDAMYDLTKYDATEEITVVINRDGKEEKIVLEQKGEK